MLKVIQIKADMFESDDYNQEKESLVEYACRKVNKHLPKNARIVNVNYESKCFNDAEFNILLTVFYTIPEEDVVRSL